MEAEVAGLDHAGVDGPDGHLVNPVSAHGRHPGPNCRVRDQPRIGEWPSKCKAVEVVSLALIPARRLHQVDDAVDALAAGAAGDDAQLACAVQQRVPGELPMLFARQGAAKPSPPSGRLQGGAPAARLDQLDAVTARPRECLDAGRSPAAAAPRTCTASIADVRIAVSAQIGRSSRER